MRAGGGWTSGCKATNVNDRRPRTQREGIVSNRLIAEKIVEELFTNGNGDKADRIQLCKKSGGILERNLGGWCKASAVDAIVRVLEEHNGVPEVPQ